mmetsp:Transcript_5972/g.11747  ORF Transcript_5972/g.11747 Transcript_5972/m.11747 type:complete len:321 (-) Transcript_5972:77-1039(-)
MTHKRMNTANPLQAQHHHHHRHHDDDVLQTLRHDINGATLALAEGGFQDEAAIQELTRALQAVMSALRATSCQPSSSPQQGTEHRQNNNTNNMNSCHQDEDDVWMRMEEPEDAIQVKALTGLCTESEQEQGPPNNPLMFRDLFLIAPLNLQSSTTTINDPWACLTSMCALALYNLGVARHVQAVSTTTASSSTSSSLSQGQGHTNNDTATQLVYLQAAKDLYEQCSDLLDRLPLSIEGTVVYVYMAACNNLCVLHSHKHDAAQVENWSTTLSNVLQYIVVRERAPAYQHFVRVCDHYGVAIDVIPSCTSSSGTEMDQIMM